jgi:hypothetical protein
MNDAPQPEHTQFGFDSSIDALGPASLLTSADVAEFVTLMREECGETLDASTAYVRATELVRLMRDLVAPQEGTSSKNARPRQIA